MQNHSNANKLLAAVGEYLKSTLSSQVPSYQCRIALNILAVAQRELELGIALTQHSVSELQQLLQSKESNLESLEQQLCRAIESGSMDIQTPGLTDYLWSAAIGQVSIDQPSYSTYLKVST